MCSLCQKKNRSNCAINLCKRYCLITAKDIVRKKNRSIYAINLCKRQPIPFVYLTCSDK